MTLRITADKSSCRKQAATDAPPKPSRKASRDPEGNEQDRSQNASRGHDARPQSAVPLAKALQSPGASSASRPPSAVPSALSQLPDELTVMMAAQLPFEDAIALRHASSNFLRLSDDPQVLRDQYRRARLGLPRDLSSPEARAAA